MRYERVHIGGFGYELPPHVVTSEDLEARLAPLYQRLHLRPGQLESLTGIAERRYWDRGFAMHEGATRAGRKALAAAGVGPRRRGHAGSMPGFAGTIWNRPRPVPWPMPWDWGRRH